MSPTQAVVLLAILSAIVFGAIRFLDFIEKDAKSTWWVVAEGIYTQSVTQPIGSRVATGMTGYYAKLPPMIWATLVFKDSTRIKVINIGELPPPGTYIKVLQNGRAEFKIETLDTPPLSNFHKTA